MDTRKPTPLCTVVIPTIGRPKHFGMALASVAAQTYKPLEILVSDNAANPPVTAEEIETRASGADVRLIRRDERINGPEHFNRCIKDATGEYIFLFADDDIMTPDLIRAAMQAMLADDSVKVVVAVQETISEEFAGEIPNPTLTSYTVDGNEFAKSWTTGGTPGLLNISAMLARKSDLLGYGGFRPYPTGSGSDIFIFFQLCLGQKVGIVSGGYLYRVYGSSVGLSAPWSGLYAAVNCLDADLFSLFQEGRMERHTAEALIRNNTRLLYHRWKTIYRHRAGWGNKLKPLVDVAVRCGHLFAKFGVRTVPVFHKLLSPSSPR